MPQARQRKINAKTAKRRMLSYYRTNEKERIRKNKTSRTIRKRKKRNITKYKKITR